MPSPNLTEQIKAHIKTASANHNIDLEPANTYQIITFKPEGTTHAIRTPAKSKTWPTYLALAFFTLLTIPCFAIGLRKGCDEKWSSWEVAAFGYTFSWNIFLFTEWLRVFLRSVFARAVGFGMIMVGSCVFAGYVVPVCDG